MAKKATNGKGFYLIPETICFTSVPADPAPPKYIDHSKMKIEVSKGICFEEECLIKVIDEEFMIFSHSQLGLVSVSTECALEGKSNFINGTIVKFDAKSYKKNKAVCDYNYS